MRRRADKYHVLVWIDDGRFTEGLRELKHGEHFLTIRLGTKWADTMNPGDKVVLLTKKDGKEEFVGISTVACLRKGRISQFRYYDYDLLNRNIGAKKWGDVIADMAEVYIDGSISDHTVVSTIEMIWVVLKA